MLDHLRKLFSPQKPALSEESHAFIENLAPSFIWILAIGIRGTPRIHAMQNSTKRDIVADHRIELADIGDYDSVVPFNFRQDGLQVLPFFSSENCAREFLATKPLLGDTSFFQPYRLRAGFVTAPGNEKFNLVLDAGLPSERRLLPAEKEFLRAITTAA